MCVTPLPECSQAFEFRSLVHFVYIPFVVAAIGTHCPAVCVQANIRMLIPLPASMKGVGNVVNYGGANDLNYVDMATSWPPPGPQICTNQKLITLNSFSGTWASGEAPECMHCISLLA